MATNGNAVTQLEIRVFGDPVLRQQARLVDDFDGALRRLADDMMATMRAADGVGLAANQVGVLKRLFTWETMMDDDQIVGGAVVNPELIEASETLQQGDEGCLSFPGLSYPLERPLRVEVAHQDLDGERHVAQLEGFAARIWLHEMDHLNGILFIDHLAMHDRRAAIEAMRRLRDDRGGHAPPAAGSLLTGR